MMEVGEVREERREIVRRILAIEGRRGKSTYTQKTL
jgi:hypothetical protein